MRLQNSCAALRSTLLLIAVVLAGPAAAQQLAAGTPEATVRTLHRGLAEAADGDDIDERYRRLLPIVVATHDLPYIAEFSIRRQWPGLSAEDKQRFVTAFEKLSVMTYASRFIGVGEDTFTISGTTETDAARAQVTAAIKRADAPDVPLEYLLHERDGSWKIINIVADGVSDLALKRAEYQRILGAGTLDDLIRHLDEQTARLP